MEAIATIERASSPTRSKENCWKRPRSEATNLRPPTVTATRPSLALLLARSDLTIGAPGRGGIFADLIVASCRKPEFAQFVEWEGQPVVEFSSVGHTKLHAAIRQK